MKKIILIGVLIVALAVGVFGCGKAAKVKELNDYLQQEEKVSKKFEDDFTVLEKNSNDAQSLEDFSKFFTQGKELTNKASNDLKALNTPVELKAYKNKELELLGQLSSGFDSFDKALKTKDPAQIESEGKKIDESMKNLGNNKEDEAILKQVAKDAGIVVEIKDNSVLFKEK